MFWERMRRINLSEVTWHSRDQIIKIAKWRTRKNVSHFLGKILLETQTLHLYIRKTMEVFISLCIEGYNSTLV